MTNVKGAAHKKDKPFWTVALGALGGIASLGTLLWGILGKPEVGWATSDRIGSIDLSIQIDSTKPDGSSWDPRWGNAPDPIVLANLVDHEPFETLARQNTFRIDTTFPKASAKIGDRLHLIITDRDGLEHDVIGEGTIPLRDVEVRQRVGSAEVVVKLR